MKLTAILLFKDTPEGRDNPILLACATDLSSFSFFQRKSLREAILFAGRTVAKRIPVGQRQCVTDEVAEYVMYAFKKEGLACLICADGAYPKDSAFAAVHKVIEDYVEINGEKWRSVEADNLNNVPWLEESLANYQDPMQADKIAKIKNQIEETKGAVEVTLKKLLNRGESIETLAAISNDLSDQSKMFVKNAKSLNRCCTLL